MKVWESDGELSLLDLLKADPEVTAHARADRARRAVRPRLPFQARRHDLRPGVRRRRPKPGPAISTDAIADLAVTCAMSASERRTRTMSQRNCTLRCRPRSRWPATERARPAGAAICSSCRSTGSSSARRKTFHASARRIARHPDRRAARPTSSRPRRCTIFATCSRGSAERPASAAPMAFA